MCDFSSGHCGTVTGSGGLLPKSFFSESSDWMPGDHGSTTFEVEELLTDPEQLRFKSQTIFVSCGS